MIDKPKTSIHSDDPDEEERSASLAPAANGKMPKPTGAAKKDHAKQPRHDSEYSVWSFVASWKLVRAGFRFLDAHNGSITALATDAILLLTGFYVTYSKKQWETMVGANGISQKTFEVSQQASVTLGRKDGVVAELRNSHNPKLQDGLVIYFQNSGHMPAKLNWGVDVLLTRNPIVRLPVSNPFQPMKRTRNKKTGAITEDWSTDGSIGGDAVREVAVGYLPPGFVDSLSSTNKQFEVNGTYEYCDELGRYACRSFSLIYQQVPFGTFRIIRDNECIDRSWLGNTNPGSDEEILPLCVQRNAPPFPND